MKQVEITILGKVQGVAFRYSAQMMAETLGLKGYVKNLYNGSVYIVAQGNEEQIDILIQWCHKGPTRARVDKVMVDWMDSLGTYESFEIR